MVKFVGLFVSTLCRVRENFQFDLFMSLGRYLRGGEEKKDERTEFFSMSKVTQSD